MEENLGVQPETRRFCLEAGWAGDKYVWFGNNRGHKGRMVGVTISITIG